MGAPVVTWPGATMASRQTVGFLAAVDLEDLAAQDAADYVAIAANLAADVERRLAIRSTLRQRISASPLGDARAFTASLEAAYRVMWRRRCAGAEPAAFAVRSAGA
jgi:predicted O-linked N-acetylglucosamine transferase (SPINDLY family)